MTAIFQAKKVVERKPCLGLILTIVFLLTSCGQPQHESTQIEPSSATVTVGETLQFQATGLDPEGEKIEDLEFAWSVEGDAGRIDDKGLLTALKPGTLKVAAVSGDVRAEATVTVERQKVAAFALMPEPSQVEIEGTSRVQITAKSAKDEGIPGVEVTASTPTSGAKVEPAKAVTDANGQAVFTLTVSPKAQPNRLEVMADDQTASVEVLGSPGPPANLSAAADQQEVTATGTTRVRASVRDRAGNPVPGVSVSFEATTPQTSIEPTEVPTDEEGRAAATLQTSTQSGVNTVGVSVAGLERQELQIRVRPGEPATVSLTSETPDTIAGGTLEISAQVSDTYGNPVPNTAVTFRALTEGTSIEDTSLTTDAQGRAGTTLETSLEPGPNQVEVAVGGLAPAGLSITGNPAAALRVTPEKVAVEMLGSQQFRALATDEAGHTTAVPADWRLVGDAGSVDSQGLFTAGKLGEDAVVASYRNLTGGATLTVIPGAPAKIDISPSEASVVSGENQQFDAVVLNAHDHPLQVSPVWSVTGGVGTIDASGLFTATRAGTAAVVAAAGETTAEATVVVTPGALADINITPDRLAVRAGEQVQLNAEGVDAAGNVVAIEPLWSLTADLGSIESTGLFRAQYVGSGHIRVEGGTPPIIKQVPVEVVSASLASIEVDPRTLTLNAGEEQKFTAQGYDASGNLLEAAPIWSVSEEIATIDESGNLVARKTGSAEVIATVGALTGRATVTVNPGPLVALEVSPAGPITLPAGATTTLNVTGKDAFDNVVALAPDWEQTVPLGSFEPGNIFRAEKVGTGELIVRAAEQSATVDVTILPGKLAKIVVEPDNPEPRAGEQLTFKATGLDAYDNAVTIEPTWRVVDHIGDITERGEFTALQAREGRVVATAGGVAGSTTVTVLPNDLALLKVTPLRFEATAGEQVPITVIGYDTYGNPVPVNPVWQIPNDLGEVDPDGVFTARRVGEGQMVVATGPLAELIDVKVNRGSLAQLQITPASINIRSGDEQQFSVEGLDAGGNPVEVEPEWEVTDSIGTIDASGLFTATLAGKGRATAKVGDLSAHAAVIVEPGAAVNLNVTTETRRVRAGSSVALEIEAVDAAGNAIVTQPKWSVEGDLGSVSDDGVFHARTAGFGTITATLGEVSTTIEIEVYPASLARIALTPSETEVIAGEEQTFTATGFDRYDNRVEIFPSWSLQGDIGVLDPHRGIFKAEKSGTGLIVASNNFIAGTATIRVRPGTVSRLAIEPADVTVRAGEEVKLTAIAYDEYDNVTSAELQWDLTEPLGSLDNGLFTAEKTGESIIVVSHQFLKASSSVRIEQGPLVRLEIIPSQLTLTAGKSLQMGARGYDRFGNPGELAATWRVVGDIGTVDPHTGEFTAGRKGTGKLVAQLNNLTAEAQVRTVAGAVERLSVSPETAEVRSAMTQEFEAVGIDAGGNELPVKVKWAVMERLGTVSPDGKFAAKGLGQGKIVAYLDNGLIAANLLEVGPGAVSLLFVSPQPTTVRAGETTRFEVKGFDANRNPIPDIEAKWKVLGDIGDVDPETGAFSAKLVGWGKVQATIADAVGDADVQVTPGAPNAAKSRLTSSRVEIIADGKMPADIAVFVRDRYGNPVADVPVTLISRLDDRIDQPGVTNEQGVAVGRIRSDKTGFSEVSAIVGSVRINNTLQLQFYRPGAAG